MLQAGAVMGLTSSLFSTVQVTPRRGSVQDRQKLHRKAVDTIQGPVTSSQQRPGMNIHFTH